MCEPLSSDGTPSVRPFFRDDRACERSLGNHEQAWGVPFLATAADRYLLSTCGGSPSAPSRCGVPFAVKRSAPAGHGVTPFIATPIAATPRTGRNGAAALTPPHARFEIKMRCRGSHRLRRGSGAAGLARSAASRRASIVGVARFVTHHFPPPAGAHGQSCATPQNRPTDSTRCASLAGRERYRP